MEKGLKELENIMKYREVKKAKDNLQKVIGEIIVKYAIPGVNYIEHFGFEFKVRTVMKKMRGW